MDRTFSRYGEKRAGTQNKYYEVEAIELENGRATWCFRWARIGYECNKPKEGETWSFEEAKRICEAQFTKKEQTSGYREVSAMEALASASQEVSERKNNGYEPVALEIPCFQAGTSEARCRKLCEKWLAKLNLVRGSAHDLGNEYGKQVAGVWKGFANEWDRIRNTKAHGLLRNNSEAQLAFQTFFMRLRDNTRRKAGTTY